MACWLRAARHRAKLCFAKCESAKFSPLEMVPVETGKSLLGELLPKKFHTKTDTAAGPLKGTINTTQMMLWVK